MENAEKETIINLNWEDLREGWFHFYTSVQSEYEKLCKRVGGKKNLIEVEVEYGPMKEPWGWDCKVPLKFLCRANWSIRPPRVRSEAQKEQTKRAGLKLKVRSKTPGGKGVGTKSI